MDKLILHWERDEEYSVISFYHLLRVKRVGLKEGPYAMHNASLWRKIWKASILPQNRSFVWFFGKNILPTKANMWKKGLKINSFYPFCFEHTETIQHVFLDCHFAKLV